VREKIGERPLMGGSSPARCAVAFAANKSVSGSSHQRRDTLKEEEQPFMKNGCSQSEGCLTPSPKGPKHEARYPLPAFGHWIGLSAEPGDPPGAPRLRAEGLVDPLIPHPRAPFQPKRISAGGGKLVVVLGSDHSPISM